jgi:dihydrofolate reductase
MATGKLTLTTFLTLDGVMQAPGAPDEDRSGNFQHGGWLVPYFGDDMMRIVNDAFARADAFLLGRKTYEIFASHWPRVTDPDDLIAAALNRLPKYVVSKSLKNADWKGTTIIRSEVTRQIGELKSRYPREIQVHGSGNLAQTLFANDLVDEFHLWHYPVVLGSGKRLFGSGTVPAALSLFESRRTDSGVMVNSYRRAGKPTYGSFGLETETTALS